MFIPTYKNALYVLENVVEINSTEKLKLENETKHKIKIISGTRIKLRFFKQEIPQKTNKMATIKLTSDVITPNALVNAAVKAETEINIKNIIITSKITPIFERWKIPKSCFLWQDKNIKQTKKKQIPQRMMFTRQTKLNWPKNIKTSRPEAKPAPITVPRSKKTTFKISINLMLNFMR